MAGDTDYSSVVLWLPCDGANNSTTFDDLSPSPRTITANGDAKISTAQSKYGGTSLKLDGSGNYLSVAHNSALSLVGVDFTIEAWIYVNALTAATSSILDKDGVNGTSYAQYTIGISSTGKIAAFLGNGNGVSPTGTGYTSSTTVTTGVWHHVALVKSGSTCKGFLDGVEEWSSSAPTMYDGSKALLIGYSAGQPSSAYFNGYIDDLRITKGVARYTADFTPPDAFSLFEVSGVVVDRTGAPATRTVRAYRRDTGAFLKEGVSTAGSYNLKLPYAGEVNVICLDDVAGSVENDLILRTTAV